MPESTSIGQTLKQARTAKKISIKQVTKVIHVKEIYLEAIEKDRFEDLPSPVQGRGFIRLYWSHLGLDPQDLELLLHPQPTAVEPEIAAEPNTPKLTIQQRLQTGLKPGKNTSSKITPVEHIKELPPAEPDKTEETNFGPARPSQEIIAGIGAELRDQRERLSLSLENIETYTHIPIHYLRALEDGRMNDLPSPVQGRGMLSNYATFLNMDVDRILMQYADVLQLRREEKEQATTPEKKKRLPPKVGKPSVLKSLFSLDIAFVGLLIIAALVALIWGAGSILTYRQTSENQPTERPISEILIATSTYSGTEEAPLTPTLAETPDLFSTPIPDGGEVAAIQDSATATVSGTPPTLPNYAVNLFIVAQQRSFLKITVDDKVVFNGRTVPNTPYNYSGVKQIQLVSGNAAAISITYNGINLGTLGTTGAVLDIIFDGTMYGTPTYTPTDTATETLRPSRTPKPSNTYPPTRTKTNTATPLPTKTPKPTHTPLAATSP